MAERDAEMIRSMTDVQARLASVERRLETAHERITSLEQLIRQDLKDIRSDLQPLRDWMNRGRGAIAGLLALAGVAGGLVTMAIGKWWGA